MGTRPPVFIRVVVNLLNEIYPGTTSGTESQRKPYELRQQRKDIPVTFFFYFLLLVCLFFFCCLIRGKEIRPAHLSGAGRGIIVVICKGARRSRAWAGAGAGAGGTHWLLCYPLVIWTVDHALVIDTTEHPVPKLLELVEAPPTVGRSNGVFFIRSSCMLHHFFFSLPEGRKDGRKEGGDLIDARFSAGIVGGIG